MEGFKKVFDTRFLKDLEPMFWPIEKAVMHPHTEIEPPTGDGIQITGFDFNINEWQFIKAATPEDVENQDMQLTDAFMAIAELYELGLDYEMRIAELEAKLAEQEAE
ncbi:hypothetical protein JZO81_19450 [Enterococcus hulanensis]|uniref:hypothetical protein n=1 Tax=Enterococcus TaxID=1350 RepID=UPI000B5A42D9|nr:MULTISPECIES: hypothetical protein [Enterococcus]MBO0413237.1 hypothetical protein [Enterococcus hulanensis]OTO15096.1 hypothetical protein A5875_004253 [Enterococcus sp. 3H8_DIV0648]